MLERFPWWLSQALPCGADRLNDHWRVQTDLIGHKLIWMQSFNPERLEVGFGKIFEDKRDNRLGLAVNRGGQHVPIINIRQLERVNQGWRSASGGSLT
jgi:hypothetical protein